MAIWHPDLSDRTGPHYLRIVEAMAADIASGTLAPGTRLPPHRELAYRLGLSANTTSRAYAEATARGFLKGEVGRGTFVRQPSPPAPGTEPADLTRPAAGPIDLSRNLPPPGTAAEVLAASLAALGRSQDLRPLVDYRSDGSDEAQAEAGIAWMRRAGLQTLSAEVIVTHGAQNGIFLTLMALTSPGDVVAVEALTYAPIKAMAERLGLRLVPLPMDENGACPDALAALCASHAVRAAYLMPTLQTPTTVSMPEERRRALAEVARRDGLVVIEDDVFGHLVPEPVPPLATHLPESTVYATSISKCLAPGLRVGFLRAPDSLAGAIRSALALTTWMVPPLVVEIAARWIADGTADTLTARQRAAVARRQEIARSTLEGVPLSASPWGMHLWLALPEGWSGEGFCATAAARGVKVTDAGAFATDPRSAPAAVRLCLSHEADEGRLRQGLEIVRALLHEPPSAASLII